MFTRSTYRTCTEEEDTRYFIRFLYRILCTTLLHKTLDIHHVKHKLVNNKLPPDHVMHGDTQVPPNCRGAGKQAVSHHPTWLDLTLTRVLSVEIVELYQ
jgi:hypothetical protein